MIIIEHTLVSNNLYSSKSIKNLIYNIRGKQVIFDYDVAKLYGYETKRINEAVKRNKNRFPERFCFQLTSEEFNEVNFEFGNLSFKRKYLPHVFTEQGIAMLSSILKKDFVVAISINIIDAFIAINQEKFLHKIFYDGQIFDAYSLIIDIIENAKFKIIIIDNYIDKAVLKILTKKKRNVNVTLFTANNCKLTKTDRVKFNAKYPSLKINITKKFHDRFIIIDDKELYHCGASLKDLGKKCFVISKINDDSFIKKLIIEVMLYLSFHIIEYENYKSFIDFSFNL